VNWWKRLLRKDELERQLDSELRFHFDRQMDDLIRNGMSAAEARRRTRLQFGGLDQVKEECRDARGTLCVENAIKDMRFSTRTLRRSPAFTVVAIITLALGIGANTAIFSVLNAVFLRPLPYVHPERLVWATEYFPKFKGNRMLMPEYAAWRQQNTAFEQLEAYGIGLGANVTCDNRAAERVHVTHITPGFFTMLGVQPQLGRTFASEEDRPNQNRVAMLSDALWRNYFNADPQILNKALSLNGKPYTVVGVMPPGFIGLDAADTGIWVPDAVNAKRSMPGRSMGLLAGVIGRLKPGVTAEAARANLEVIARRMDSQYPAPWSSYHAAASVRVLSLQEQLTAGSRTVIYVLMGAVGFILLIVCANVANMFLSRAVAREKEIALRAAIGASRSRLVRLLLIESLLLGVCGGLAGMILMFVGISVLGFLMPATIPQHVPIDARVLGFAAFCSVATSILFGLAPALAVSKLDLNTSLKEGAAHSVRHHHRFWFRGGLAVAQVALSLVLLVGAGLLVRSFVALISVNPGFSSHNVLLADVSLAPQELYGPARQAQFFRRTLGAIQKIPGVQYAAITDQSPLVQFQSVASGLAAEGQPETDATVVPTSVSADYFNALQIPLREGRFFNDGDRDGARRVVIVNQTLARILFPGVQALDRRIKFGTGKDPWVTVVGVVADIRHRGLDDKVWPELYQPYEQAPSAWMSFVVKTSTNPSGLIPAVRKAVIAIDRNQPLFDIQSLEQRLSSSVAQRRQRAFLLGSFAFLALVIAVIGVYGVMAYSVARRMHEIGIRIALGASPQSIIRNVVAQGAGMALIGVAIGLAGARGLTRVLAGFLYGVTATNTATFVSVCLLLISAACIAAYIPARRATHIDPMIALRHD
jgi:putative ABC transport system permease protein